MKNILLALMLVIGVVSAPAATMAASGYWEPYTVTQRVAYKTPSTRYICDRSYYYNDYYGRSSDCYYTTEYVTKYRNERVTKYRWVESRRYAEREYYNDDYYYDDNYSSRKTTFKKGYSRGYRDADYNRSYNSERAYDNEYGDRF
jgi:hypothetical protein